jgi:6,7-dimethyl-8-ribityllumazine synthase
MNPSTLKDKSIKGLVPSHIQYDGSNLRICIIHARWNKEIIDSLVQGVLKVLRERGVKESNIVLQSVPGSFELPLACAKFVLRPLFARPTPALFVSNINQHIIL